MIEKSNCLIINVPYYSQHLDVCVIDNKNKIYNNIIDGYWSKRSCGVVSLKMVMDYYGKFLSEYKKQPLMKLIWEGMKLGAFSEPVGGWYHRGLINLAKKYGFHGRLYDWNIGNKKKEKQRGLLIIKNILKKQKPLIVSVYKNFNRKNSGHLIVLVGYRDDIFGNLDGFYFNDPNSYDRKSRNYAFIKKNKFLNGWKGRAILITPKLNKK